MCKSKTNKSLTLTDNLIVIRCVNHTNKESQIYPYLLKNLIIYKPNQVWASDLTCIKMSKGFVYLVALIDLFSRKIMGWRLSTTMEKEFFVKWVL